LHAQRGEARAAALEPVVRATVELQEFPFAWGAHPTLTMSGSAAFARRAKTFLAKKTTKRFPGKGEAFDFTEFFAKMVVVEAGILGASQAQHGQTGALG